MKRLLTLALATSITFSYVTLVKADPISSTNKENAQNQLKQSESELGSAEDKLNKLEITIEKLDSQIESIMLTLEENKKAISKSEATIVLAKKDVQAAENEMSAQQELFDNRMKSMYKNGSQGYLAILLKSESFTQLVSNLDSINRMINYDKAVAEELETKRNSLLEKQHALEIENQNLLNLKADKESKLAKLNSNKAEQTDLISKAKAERQLLADKVKKDQEAVNTAIANMDTEAINIATKSSSSTADIQAAISYLENRNKTLKSSKITEAITKGKNIIAERNKPVVSSPTRGNASNSTTPSGYNNSSNYSGGPVSGMSIAFFSQQFIGQPYLWGGTRPYKAGDYTSGFDCSGLVQYCYKQFGISITRTCATQIQYDGRFINKDDLVAGDLIYFGTWDNPHHVGMYIGSGNFIHSPRTGDFIKIQPLSIRNDFLAAKRIIN
jgi:peptidoglycan hydrolase CwlO-like protein